MPWGSAAEARAQEVVARVLALAPTEDDVGLVEAVAADCDARTALGRLSAFFDQGAS